MVFLALTPSLIDALAEAAPAVPTIKEFFIASAETRGAAVATDTVVAMEAAALTAQLAAESPTESRLMAHHCAPIAVVRALATHRGQSLRRFLLEWQKSHAAPVAGAGGSGAPTTVGDLQLALAPTALPPNPHRAAMRARVAAIEKAVEDVRYNSLVPAQARVAVGAGRAVDPRQRIHASGRAEGLLAPSDKGAAESLSTFSRDLSIGFDMRLMSAAGAVVGYYLCYARGLGRDMCFVGAAVGAVVMLLVDAVLLIVRLARDDGHAAAQPRHRPEGLVEAVTKDADAAGKARLAAPAPTEAPASLTQRRQKQKQQQQLDASPRDKKA